MRPPSTTEPGVIPGAPHRQRRRRPVELDVTVRALAHVEDNIRRLENSAAHRFPFTDIDANKAWLSVVCFADALVRWFQLLCLTGTRAAAEPKTLRWTPVAHLRPHPPVGASLRQRAGRLAAHRAAELRSHAFSCLSFTEGLRNVGSGS